MNQIKVLGIWMDHSNAVLFELYNHRITSKKTILKKVIMEDDITQNIEGQQHSKEESHNRAAFFKEIGSIIRNYQNVLLFGPTDAKNELYNLLSVDHRFENTKFELRNTDKMTDDEMHKYVVAYFK